MANRTLEENVKQAIADFDSIKQAIVEQGVRVPNGTDTSQYGTYIKRINPEGCEVYSGEYEITPTTSKQVLPTEGKSMLDDVVITAIPFFEVSNNNGGKTVYIGSEV